MSVWHSFKEDLERHIFSDEEIPATEFMKLYDYCFKLSTMEMEENVIVLLCECFIDLSDQYHKATKRKYSFIQENPIVKNKDANLMIAKQVYDDELFEKRSVFMKKAQTFARCMKYVQREFIPRKCILGDDLTIRGTKHQYNELVIMICSMWK